LPSTTTVSSLSATTTPFQIAFMLLLLLRRTPPPGRKLSRSGVQHCTAARALPLRQRRSVHLAA
jgi:hypothetical protein